MNYREFNKSDADFCFKTRTTAFIKYFIDELGKDKVAIGVNSILPNDYIRLSSDMKIFIVEDGESQVGFITIKRIDKATAEIPLIYFTPESIGRGYGSKSISFLENWCGNHWREVESIYLDTVIPDYNGKFYEKMGFRRVGDSHCFFMDVKVSAVRFEKFL